MKTLVLILGLLTAFGPLSIDMYLPAFSAIAKDFGAPISDIQYSLSSFFVGLALGQVFYGPVTDRFGRKKPLYFGLAVYTIASLACARAANAQDLALFRFLQALGSCAGMVISRAVVRDKFHARDAAKTFSLLMLIMGVAPILAPALGGQMLEVWSWRSIFIFLAALSVLALAAVAFFLPETHEPDMRTSLRKALPIFKEILKDREFLGYSLSCAVAYGGLFAYITGSAFVFVEHFGFSPKEYSVLFGLNASGIILFSQLNTLLLRKRMPQQILKMLYPIAAVFGLCLILIGLFFPNKFAIISVLWVFLATMGIMFPNATASALAKQKRAGSASALLGTIQFGASALISGTLSAFHNESVVPMTFTVGACAICAFLIYSVLITRRP